MLSSTSPERLGNKEVFTEMLWSPWEGGIDVISWAAWGWVEIGAWGTKLCWKWSRRVLKEMTGGAHFGSDKIETWYKGNSQESSRMTPANTPRNNRYVSWTGHLLWSGKASSGQIRTPTKPHNVRPKVCPAYGVSWGKDGVEAVGVANRWLVQPEIHATRYCAILIDCGLLQLP